MTCWYVFVTPRPIECMEVCYKPPESEQELIRTLRKNGYEPCVSMKPLTLDEALDANGLLLFTHPLYGNQLTMTSEKGVVKYLYQNHYRILCLQDYGKKISRSQLSRMRLESLHLYGLGKKVERRITRSCTIGKTETAPLLQEPEWNGFQKGHDIIIHPDYGWSLRPSESKMEEVD